MATFRMIRTGRALVSCNVEARDLEGARQEATKLAIADARTAQWRVDHDAFDRARDDGPDTTEADAQEDAADARRFEGIEP